jgi:hypothetical protein
MELTKEYFDEQFKSLRSDIKIDMSGLEAKIEEEIANLAKLTSNGFAELEAKLKVQLAYSDDSIKSF